MMRHSTLLFVLLAGAISLILFSVKYQVQDLEAELGAMERTIASDRRAIRVLKAEWSYLNNPARLRGLAERHLGLEPVKPGQYGGIDELPDARYGNISAPGADPVDRTAPPDRELADRKESR